MPLEYPVEEGGSGMFSWRYDLKVALLCLVEFDLCRSDFFSFVISMIAPFSLFFLTPTHARANPNIGVARFLLLRIRATNK